MRVNEIRFSDSRPVEGYGPGFFRIGGAVREGPLLLLPAGPQSWAGLPAIDPLLAAAPDVDVVFFGMGAEIRAMDPEVRARLEAAGLGVEIMATPPACRTYNVLLSEGRRVAAALLPV